ncbi:MAG: hypothetical protein DCC56_03695 [Anaerolineae bacterium]|nr:MAG: hypothetical protein DCC56_03695 [Anaerolineae bacterium]WKZ44048.1 MAG: DUF2142 domain-containing protein [Anaerolineales bacterium]
MQLNKRLHAAEIYLLAVLLTFGVAVCFLLPISGGYDEETHLLRVWQMSDLRFLPNEADEGKLPFPAVYWELSYRRQFLVRAVEPDFWQKYGDLSIDAHDYIYGSVDTRSVYSPPLLLPQALTMRLLGRRQGLPALTVYDACRIVGLLSYLLLAWLAVRMIPFGKWILALLTASPVAILQAATISADAISNGLALLFLGGSIAIANRSELRWREWGGLALLLALLFLGKVNLVPLAILPFLIIPPARFKIRYGYVLLLITALALFAIEVVGWNLLAYSQLLTAPEGTNPIGQVRFILGNFPEFISILTQTMRGRWFSYLLDWIAIYGFAYWPVPAWTYYFFMLALILALFRADDSIQKRTRLGLLLVFFLAYVGTYILMYITFNPVAFGSIEGVQGRYFTTVMPLLFLGLAGLPLPQRIRLPSALPAILSALSLIFYTGGMYLSYHVVCGSQFYQAGLCYQPNYKNWAPDARYSQPVSPQLTLKQEIVPECRGVSEVRVWVNGDQADPSGMTEFVLRDVNQSRELIRKVVNNSEFPAGSWFTLHFDPDWESLGKFYLLTISSQDTGPQIAYSLRAEYPAGKLFENDAPMQEDLIFQTGCVAGWDALRQSDSR